MKPCRVKKQPQNFGRDKSKQGKNRVQEVRRVCPRLSINSKKTSSVGWSTKTKNWKGASISCLVQHFMLTYNYQT